MQRVIGLGGPFIKANDPKALAAWYEKHLGIPFNGSTYAMLPFGEKKDGFNLITFFKKESEYFSPSTKDVMVNLVVADLTSLIAALKEEGVTIVGEPTDSEYGKFGWVMDPEGNKVELWQAP